MPVPNAPILAILVIELPAARSLGHVLWPDLALQVGMAQSLLAQVSSLSNRCQFWIKETPQYFYHRKILVILTPFLDVNVNGKINAYHSFQILQELFSVVKVWNFDA